MQQWYNAPLERKEPIDHMPSLDRTALGDTMKSYEAASTSRKAFKGQPLVVRLDGKSFHTFTRGLARPFDERLSRLMVKTTSSLVEKFQATIGYTQSDEITLIWYVDSSSATEYPFGGRMQKMESLLAAFATAVFNQHLAKFIPEKAGMLPIFDTRAFVVPDLTQAYRAVLWRQLDATKNAVAMAAQAVFSHKQLHGKHTSEMQEMLWQKGINFNEYPYFFKRGTFVRRVRTIKNLTPEQMEHIPQQYRPVQPVERSCVQELDIWLTKEERPVEVLFFGEEPKEAIQHSLEETA